MIFQLRPHLLKLVENFLKRLTSGILSNQIFLKMIVSQENEKFSVFPQTLYISLISALRPSM